jgi:hypothetical protein
MPTVRHYAAPVFSLWHPVAEGRPSFKVTPVYHKRFMASKAHQSEEAVALLGGRAQPGEDRATALAREIQREAGWVGAVPADAKVVEGDGFTVTIWDAGELSQQIYEELTARRDEDRIDVASPSSALQNVRSCVRRAKVIKRKTQKAHRKTQKAARKQQRSGR